MRSDDAIIDVKRLCCAKNKQTVIDCRLMRASFEGELTGIINEAREVEVLMNRG